MADAPDTSRLIDALLDPNRAIREKNVSIERRSVDELIKADQYARQMGMGDYSNGLNRGPSNYRQRLSRTGC